MQPIREGKLINENKTMHAYIMHLKVKEKNHKKIESIITLIYLIRKKTIK